MNLNKKETALALAGLRLLQILMIDAPHQMPPNVQVILDDGDIGEGGINEVDALCENKINVVEEPDALRVAAERLLVGLDAAGYTNLCFHEGKALNQNGIWIENLRKLLAT